MSPVTMERGSPEEEEEEERQQQHQEPQVEEEKAILTSHDATVGARHEREEDERMEEAAVASSSSSPKRRKKVVKPMSKESLEAYHEAAERRGVIYVSRLPPGMKPQKLRSVMAQYGEVLRVYCTPEDASVARRRKKCGGNRGKRVSVLL